MTSAMPWVKLYTEMLDDTKLGRLNNALRWRFVSLVLLAGECDAEGYLTSGTGPMSTDDLAWRLRTKPAALAKELDTLVNVGLIANTELGWYVIKFGSRQGRTQSEKRQDWRQRQRKKRAESSGPEWETSENPEETAPVTRDTRVSPAPRVEESREEKSNSSAGAPIVVPVVLSEAGQEYFKIFKRKRWANPEQQSEFEKTEAEVGTVIMLRAVKWGGGNNIARVPAICTTARKMARGDPKPARAGTSDNGMKGWRGPG